MSETIGIASTKEDYDAAKSLFKAYAESLDFSIEFQDFEGEMNRFPDGYELVLVARQYGTAVGAVGLKENKAGICEMKRLFVAPGARSTGLGRRLCERLMQKAKRLGYSEMWLDTLERWKAAHALYLKLGFTDTPSFEYHIQPDIVYLKKAL